MNHPLEPVLCDINSRQEDSPDVFTLDIEPPRGYAGFEAGQFNMLYVPGIGEAAISISGDANDSYRLVHTIRAVGDVTRSLHRMDGQSRVGVRGPFGKPWPIGEARGKDVVIVAGGIGMAPLRPLVYALLDKRDDFGRIIIVYGARTPKDILYADELMRWHLEHRANVTVTVDVASASWRGDVGVVTRFLERLELNPENTVAMVCGPEIMMRFSASELLLKGVPVEQVFVAMERNMKCGTAFCGHCQLGPYFVCRDGPVFRYRDVEPFMTVKQF